MLRNEYWEVIIWNLMGICKPSHPPAVLNWQLAHRCWQDMLKLKIRNAVILKTWKGNHCSRARNLPINLCVSSAHWEAHLVQRYGRWSTSSPAKWPEPMHFMWAHDWHRLMVASHPGVVASPSKGISPPANKPFISVYLLYGCTRL